VSELQISCGTDRYRRDVVTNNEQEDHATRGKSPERVPAPQLHDANLDGRWNPVGTRTRPVRTFSEGFDPALLIDTGTGANRTTTRTSH
jgi:hypothetical protein